MSLKEKIKTDIKSAMTTKRNTEVSVLKMLMAAIQNKEKDKRAKLAKEVPTQGRDPERSRGKKLEELSQLNDEEILEVISSEVKKRKDSIEQYQKGNRDDLVKQEKEELGILTEYMPEQMPEEEIRKIVKGKIEELGASGPQETGKVMGAVMSELKGKAEGGVISKIVQEELKKE